MPCAGHVVFAELDVGAVGLVDRRPFLKHRRTKGKAGMPAFVVEIFYGR